jgi:hypothetical protein
MINLERLVNDIFDDEKLSDIKLQAYVDDHLIRLSNLNPGNIYDTIIVDTTNKYQAYYGNMVTEATKKAVREGLTQGISNTGDLVSYKYKNDQETYQQFFPQGVDEYYQADLPELNPILDRLAGAATTHLTAQFPADVTALTTAINEFKTARQSQLNAFSEEENVATDRRTTRKNLTLQLTFNILTLALNNLEDADTFNNYYNEQLLPIGSGSGDDGGGVVYETITVAPAQTYTIGDAPDDAVVVEIIHDAGNGDAVFCTAVSISAPCSGNTYALQPGTTFNDAFGDMNISGNALLKVTNNGTNNLVLRVRVIG